jgi:hypothetical protein
MDSCSICRYWLAPAIGTDQGVCRRYPPRPLFGAHWGVPGDGRSQVESFYPKVAAADWCGEFGKLIPGPTVAYGTSTATGT